MEPTTTHTRTHPRATSQTIRKLSGHSNWVRCLGLMQIDVRAALPVPRGAARHMTCCVLNDVPHQPVDEKSPPTHELWSGSEDGVKVWSAETGTCVAAVAAHGPGLGVIVDESGERHRPRPPPPAAP